MKCLLTFVAVVVGSFGGRADAQDSSSVAEAARILAECTKALDADCVIELSDAGSYNRSADSDYVSAQSHAFETFEQSGMKYVRFDVGSPWPEFSAQGVTYAFVPYVSELSGLPEVQAYLVGVSEDDGESWKFFDGSHITPENIPLVIPGYAGQPLPKANVSDYKPAS